jgi:hypothetical protein
VGFVPIFTPYKLEGPGRVDTVTLNPNQVEKSPLRKSGETLLSAPNPPKMVSGTPLSSIGWAGQWTAREIRRLI